MKSQRLSGAQNQKVRIGKGGCGVLMLVLGLAPMVTQAQEKSLYVDVSPTSTPDYKQIKLKPDTQVKIRSNGDLEAKCKLETVNGVTNTCNNIGTTQGSGSAPTISSFADVTLTQGASTPTLKWTTTGEVCYGVAPTSPAAWHTALPGTNTTGLSLGTLGVGTHDFKIRCYNTGGHTTDVSTWVSGVTTDSIARVTVEQSTIPSGDFCAEYLADLAISNPAEFARYNLYKAENRAANSAGGKFKRNTTYTQFSTRTGKTPGKDTGAIPYLPGYLADDEYMALSFAVAAVNTTNGTTGRFTLQMNLPSQGVLQHETIVTISPCPGDFRPRGTTADETYVSPYCRTVHTTTGATVKGNIDGGATWCPTPVGKTMYMNFALRNLGLAPANDPPPADYCSTGANCGTAFNLDK